MPASLCSHNVKKNKKCLYCNTETSATKRQGTPETAVASVIQTPLQGREARYTRNNKKKSCYSKEDEGNMIVIRRRWLFERYSREKSLHVGFFFSSEKENPNT